MYACVYVQRIYLISFLRNQLFCGLTGRYINRLPHHVEKHMTGRRYTTAKMKCVNNYNYMCV